MHNHATDEQGKVKCNVGCFTIGLASGVAGPKFFPKYPMLGAFAVACTGSYILGSMLHSKKTRSRDDVELTIMKKLPAKEIQMIDMVEN